LKEKKGDQGWRVRIDWPAEIGKDGRKENGNTLLGAVEVKQKATAERNG